MAISVSGGCVFVKQLIYLLIYLLHSSFIGANSLVERLTRRIAPHHLALELIETLANQFKRT